MSDFFSAFFGLPKKPKYPPLSKAGELIDSFDRAEKRLTKKGVSDELLAALRRIQIVTALHGEEE